MRFAHGGCKTLSVAVECSGLNNDVPPPQDSRARPGHQDAPAACRYYYYGRGACTKCGASLHMKVSLSWEASRRTAPGRPAQGKHGARIKMCAGHVRHAVRATTTACGLQVDAPPEQAAAAQAGAAASSRGGVAREKGSDEGLGAWLKTRYKTSSDPDWKTAASEFKRPPIGSPK